MKFVKGDGIQNPTIGRSLEDRDNGSLVYVEQALGDTTIGQVYVPSHFVGETGLRRSSRKAQQGVTTKSLQSLMHEEAGRGKGAVGGRRGKASPIRRDVGEREEVHNSILEETTGDKFNPDCTTKQVRVIPISGHWKTSLENMEKVGTRIFPPLSLALG